MKSNLAMKVMVNNLIALYDLKRTMPTSKCKDIHIIKEKIDRNNIYLLYKGGSNV